MSECQCLVLTDLVDSTALSVRLGDSASARLWEAHDRIARDLLRTWRGREIDKSDGFLLLFASVTDAVGYLLDYHRALNRLGEMVEARAGVHVGPLILRENSPGDISLGAKPLEVDGLAKATAARIMSIAGARQTLLSLDARAALSASPHRVRSHGHWMLKGVAEPIELFEIGDDESSFRPLVDGEKAWRVVQREGRWQPAREIAHNLPQPVNSFVGRRLEMRELRTRLGSTRLLTLAGPGGIGKTRLARQLAADVLHDHPDGVWYVELAQVGDERLVPQAVASAVGVKEDAERPVAHGLVEHLRSRRVLIVLDNCEHLLPACAELVSTLLQSAGRLRIVATSREPLRVAGEVTYPVQSLALPEGREPFIAAEVARYEATRLFVERAVAVLPSFELTEHNAGAVATICRRLDGIPLAIELAAARVRALSAEAISERLNDRFRILVGGDRTALPRQQTLRALVDWSYELLVADERHLLNRLSVFAGGWTLEAAESVAAGDGLAQADVLDLLARLVEKSLVQLEASGERYRLLETVQYYARERLVESGVADGVGERHLAYFVALGERAHAELYGEEQGRWVARLDLERENLLLAHAGCDRATEGPALGLRLVGAIQNYWSPAGLIKLGYRLTVEALARPGAGEATAARMLALYAACQLAFFMGRFEASVGHGHEGLSVARALDHPKRVADLLLVMAYALDALGDRPTTLAYIEESVEIARRIGDLGRLSFALNALGGLLDDEGSDRAVPLLEESLELVRALGDGESVAITAQNLARALIRRGAVGRARELLLEAVQIAKGIGSRPTLLYVVDTCTGLAVAGAEWELAARMHALGEGQREYLALPRIPGDAAVVSPWVERARAELGVEAFEAASTEGRTVPFDFGIDELWRWLAGTEPR